MQKEIENPIPSCSDDTIYLLCLQTFTFPNAFFYIHKYKSRCQNDILYFIGNKYKISDITFSSKTVNIPPCSCCISFGNISSARGGIKPILSAVHYFSHKHKKFSKRKRYTCIKISTNSQS